MKKLFIFLLLSTLVSGCATVQQIDRGRLAKRTMQLEAFPHEASFVSEMHNIREGSAGGEGQSAGGGCGCN